MSKASELDQNAKRYILECIDGTGHNRELKTTAEKIAFLRETFTSEYGHEIERKGKQKALSEWFSGLPSACTVEFRNHEILKIAEKWGSINPYSTERARDKILEQWFIFLAAKTLQLFDGYRVPKEPENGRL